MGTLHYVREGQLGTWIRIVETLFDGPVFEFGIIPSSRPSHIDQQPASATFEHTTVNLFPEKN